MALNCQKIVSDLRVCIQGKTNNRYTQKYDISLNNFSKSNSEKCKIKHSKILQNFRAEGKINITFKFFVGIRFQV